MTLVNGKYDNRSKEFDYLCVEDFIQNILCARALSTAFEISLIDFLLQNQQATIDTLTRKLGADSRGLQLLLSLLMENRVVEDFSGKIQFTDEFVHALKFRELLELKLSLANFAAHDILDYFGDFITKPDQFMRKVRFCRLFSYDKCFYHTEENYGLTKRWMRITTLLTKYEAEICMKYHDFGQYERVLDIGGNSGEFILRICKRYSNIHGTVFDLPLVCDIGMEHISSEPESNRISFMKGNALTDNIPKGFDLISFKSMLHDWPEKEARHFIWKASQALNPGGTLFIFERGPIEVDKRTLRYSMIPFLLFFHSFRSPIIYEEILHDLNFHDISVERIELEMPFYLVTAKKKEY
jgi:SAM-dependent methyltransferase